jgi:hypothetical protein
MLILRLYTMTDEYKERDPVCCCCWTAGFALVHDLYRDSATRLGERLVA